MAGIGGIEVVVFDVLGTLVDEPGGLRAALGDDELVTVWQRHVETEQRRIAEGQRAYANSEVIDREAAEQVAARAGITEPAAVARLATAGQRLPAWPDSAAGLGELARRFAVVGLSNASRVALLRLSAHAGLRWHQALSGETARACKPAPEVYRLAIDTAGCPPDRVLMVAAHAWDLRAAQAAGLRTAYVERPGGDPPAGGDAFDGRFGGLGELVNAL
ncbi:haloacid dehalogenase type II [Amycolatopsis albispora]|uniref:HAD family hydrolase n=1 Tax=Amycolatopsis albispora TaxID=1804986 RepID=A0A344L3X5_9PSEU|nr:haloacid dehalogenase type II [Amycolatopsis albispora]AXB42749.1 HAD family hydrolase [Amycolatopsis albispora]